MKMFRSMLAMLVVAFSFLSPLSASAFSLANLFPPHQPNGFRDTGCDPAFQKPIKNEAGEILYWNNPTCPSIDPSFEGEQEDEEAES